MMETGKEEKIREELADKLAEREAIVSGKTRISSDEEKKYNILGKAILELRRKLY